jgi:hypothetical protein
MTWIADYVFLRGVRVRRRLSARGWRWRRICSSEKKMYYNKLNTSLLPLGCTTFIVADTRPR